MKLRYIFVLALRSLSDRMVRHFFILFMLIACISLFGISLLFVQSYRYNRMSCEKAFPTDLTRTGYFNYFGEELEDGEEADIKPFLDALGQMEEITVLGESCILGTNLTEDIFHVQEGYQSASYETTGDVELTFITDGMRKICPWKLSEEMDSDKQKELVDREIMPLYFGAAFRDVVKVGQRISQNGGEYFVAGLLESDQRWVAEEMSWKEIPEITSLYNTDHMIFFMRPDEEPMSSQQYYVLDDTCDVSVVEQKIQALAKENHVNLDLLSIDTMLKQQEQMNSFAIVLVKRLFLLGMLVSVIVMCSLQISSYYINKREYGIMYVTGMSGRDIFHKLLWENSILFGLALLSTHLLFYAVIPLYFEYPSWGILQYFIWDIYYVYTLPYILLLSVILAGMVTVIPQLIFQRISPAQLLK